MRKSAFALICLFLLWPWGLNAQQTPQLETTSFVVLGEGLAAGLADFSLREVYQQNSFPALMAKQIGTAFPQPLMQAPGIASLHATTFTNAVHYSWQHAQSDETRRLLLVQNAAFLPLYRGNAKDKGIRIDKLEPAEGDTAPTLDEIGVNITRDKLAASRQILAWLKANPDPQPLAVALRRLVFLKGRDSHDYKFSSAVLEDYHQLASPWRDRFLAASPFWLKGSGDKDNELVQRTREALG